MTRSFHVTVSGDLAVFSIRTSAYDPFGQWIPFSDFGGGFAESIPMQTSFTVPLHRKDEAIAIMRSKGYSGGEWEHRKKKKRRNFCVWNWRGIEMKKNKSQNLWSLWKKEFQTEEEEQEEEEEEQDDESSKFFHDSAQDDKVELKSLYVCLLAYIQGSRIYLSVLFLVLI